ncbi:MAG TPA: DMT family transporter [Alphaproteobacteria bacterium]|nr:DMT family transporter [Alphaproteobacteria bacterium]
MISAPTLAMILALISAIMHATNSVLLKKSHERLLLRAWMGFGAAIISFPFIFFVPFPSGNVWIYLGLSGIVHFFYQILLINSYRLADLTVVYPIARGISPLMITLGALLFLDEQINLQSGFGIALITSGILLLAIENGFASSGSNRSKQLGIFLALLTGLGITSYTLIDTHGIRLSENLWSYILWYFLISENTLMILYLNRRYKGRLLSALWPHKGMGLLAAILSLGSYGLALVALRFGPAAQVAAMRETSVIFGTILGVFFLKERCSWARVMAAMSVVTGCILTRL